MPRRIADADQSIGRYLVIDELGRGAMGVVLRAYDPRLQREVALKLVGTPKLSASARRRLVREARALAKLSHPNVVAVYDVEDLPEAGVVVVMERIEGASLARWLDGRPTWAEIVRAFVDAGHGLAAAHRAGLLHRDFKPSNVIRSEDERIYVADFGLARTRDEGEDVSDVVGDIPDDGSGTDPVTQPGGRVGTPAYMAPEQLAGEPIGPAADQYALCVSLWEGITGRRPFAGQAEAILEDKRSGVPDWPQTVAVPAGLVRAIKRGLAPEPSDRYPSLLGLLEDLRAANRHRERSRRWRAVAAAAVGGIGIWWAVAPPAQDHCARAANAIDEVWGPERSAQAESAMLKTGLRYAPSTWAGISNALDAYGAQWKEVYREACEASAGTDTNPSPRMECLERARLKLVAVTDLLVAADADVVQRSPTLARSLPPLDWCLDGGPLPTSPSPGQAADTSAIAEIRASLARADSLKIAGKFDEAQVLIDASSRRMEELDYEPLWTEIGTSQGALYEESGQYKAAQATMLDVLHRALRWGQWYEARIAATRLAMITGYRQARPPEALAYAHVASGLAYRSDMPPIDRAMIWDVTSIILYTAGKYEDSESLARRALATRRELLGPDHSMTQQSRRNLATILLKREKNEEAREILESELARTETELGTDHPNTIGAMANYSSFLFLHKEFEQAAELGQRALEAADLTLGRDHERYIDIANNLGVIYSDMGDHASGQPLLEEALAGRRRVLGRLHPKVGETAQNLGSALADRKRYAESEPMFREALEIKTKTLDPDHPSLALTQFTLGSALAAQDKFAEARPLLERSWATRSARHHEVPATIRAETAFALARVLAAMSTHPERVEELAALAAESFLESELPAQASDVETFLARQP